jgi:ABC-type phosphate/phosphonate transport system substrate-binding protein
MVKHWWTMPVLVLIAGLVVLLTAPLPTPAQTPAGTLRIGLVKTLFRDTPEAVVQIGMRPFQAFLETHTGLTGQVVCCGDAYAVGRKLKEDQVQLAVLHGVEFAWAKQRYPSLRALIVAVNRYPTLQALLVVRQKSKATGYADLEGKVVALPVQNKEHCRLYFDRHCVKPGVAPDKFYREVATPSDPEDALHDVFEENADATVVDRVALEAYRKTHAARGRQLKVIQESESFPCAVVAYDATHLTDDLSRRLRTSLLGAKDSRAGQQVLERIRITGFEEVPADFEKQLTEIARAYPAPASR